MKYKLIPIARRMCTQVIHTHTHTHTDANTVVCVQYYYYNSENNCGDRYTLTRARAGSIGRYGTRVPYLYKCIIVRKLPGPWRPGSRRADYDIDEIEMGKIKMYINI